MRVLMIPICYYKGKNTMSYTLQDNLAKLDDISNLKYNWNGYNAKPIPKEIIVKTKEILTNLPYQPFIAPTGRETIQIEFELEDKSYLEFEIFTDNITILYVPQRDYKKAIEKPLEDECKLNDIVKSFIENNIKEKL